MTSNLKKDLQTSESKQHNDAYEKIIMEYASAKFKDSSLTDKWLI